MGSVRTPIVGGPRPPTSQRRADDLYTLICAEPIISTTPHMTTARQGNEAPDGGLREWLSRFPRQAVIWTMGPEGGTSRVSLVICSNRARHGR